MGVSGQRHARAVRLPPGKGPPVPIVQEAGWASEPVWTQRLEEKSFCLCRRSNLDRPVVHLVIWWCGGRRIKVSWLLVHVDGNKYRHVSTAGVLDLLSSTSTIAVLVSASEHWHKMPTRTSTVCKYVKERYPISEEYHGARKP